MTRFAREVSTMKALGKLFGLTLVLLAPMLFLVVDTGQAIDWASVTDDRLLNADKDPNNWLMYYRTYNGWRYSPLSQVNRQTVRKLVPKWMFSLGEVGDQESTPMVNNGVMVVTSSSIMRGRVYALDAATGAVLWKYERKYPEDLPELTVRLPMNRGVALYRDKVYVGTLDAQLIALNAKTGEVVWEKAVADYKDGYFITMAPMAVKDKIVIGISGPGEMGNRGFVEAFNADDGQSLWRTYTVPGPGEKGNETWAGDSWKHGGGAVWLTGTYDPESNTLYFGTGNPAPWIAHMRKGDNLWTSSSIALDADSGRFKWGHQHLANDPWDYDTPQEHLVLDLTRDGRMVKAVVQANKLGFVNILDRIEGRLLSADLFATHVTWFKGRDPQTGKGIPNYDLVPQMGGPKVELCPSVFGATGWAHRPYNPETGYMYIPAIESCMRYDYAGELKYQRGKLYTGSTWELFMKGDQGGVLRAFDVAKGRIAWEWWTKVPLVGANAVTTGGGLVFVGIPEGKLLAMDAKTGEQLWEFNVGTPVSGSTVTYSVGGKQYVATVAGGMNRMPVWFGKEPKLADWLKKTNLGGMVVAFGLAE
jgi:alcohol dehydrogenase (cytochrome c)